MGGLSKVIVVDPDVRASRQVQLGFEREGLPTAAIAADVPLELELLGDDAGLVVVGGVDGQGSELVRRVRAALDGRGIDAPIVFAGRGVQRDEAIAAGADEVMLQPAYLRDVVTIGRLLRGVPAGQRAHLIGNLVEVTGVYTLVRALAALGRSATLTLIRGLRRGEVRFYFGEVTSAQVGMIHGQAALHQLLLWTDARFDFHHEDVVRRQQIPLSHDELFADAERFLEGVRSSSGGLSPSLVLEPNAPRVQSLGKQIPTEVYGVLRMFDGHRLLADVLEDSAYRVFETLRVAQRAVDVGLLRVVPRQQPRATWRTVLAIEEWLVGKEIREPPVATPVAPAPVVARGSVPVERDGRERSRKRRRRKRRVNTTQGVGVGAAPPKQEVVAVEIDWGALVPRIVGAEVGPLAGVVPAAHVSGEIIAPQRAAMPDTRDSHTETVPKVVLEERSESTASSAAPQIAAGGIAEVAVADEAKAKADAWAKADAEAAETERSVYVSAQVADAVRMATETGAHRDGVTSDVAEAAAPPGVASGVAEAAAHPGADADVPAAARADAHAAAVVGDVRTTRRAATERDSRLAPDLPVQADVAERDASALADASGTEPQTSGATAVDAQAGTGRGEPAIDTGAGHAGGDLGRVDTARMETGGDPGRVDTARMDAATIRELNERARVVENISNPAVGPEQEIERAPFVTAGVAVAETASTTVIVQDIVTVEVSGATTAKITATPSAVVRRISDEGSGATTARLSVRAAERASRSAHVAGEPALLGAATDSAPAPVTDEPSDGIIIQHIASAETTPGKRRRLPSDPPDDDRPDDATGEITLPRSHVVEPRPSSEPSILVADLAAMHAMVSVHADERVTARIGSNAATPAREAAVLEARSDAVAFSEAEEAFFRAGHDHHEHHEKEVHVRPAVVAETFDDLDEGYRPVGFWDKLRGKKKPRRTRRVR